MKKSSLFFAVLIILASAASSLADTVTPLPEETVTASADREDTALLSPGTVTVVKPQEMAGEQKNLPELLKRVPGLHVVETKGRGGYTVASVRGSSAAEVSVFVDGTLMNLGSEAAVDLSTIPVGNVERIEVYRGYIPARFAGASMGGVINIITKKTTKPGGSVSVGVGSYGKFNTGLSYGMPLGDGNFFFGANYERTDGDFDYWNDNGTPYNKTDDYSATRQNNGYKNSDVLMKWNDKNWSILGSWKRSDRGLVYEAAQADKPTSPKGAHQDTDEWIFSVARRQKSGIVDWGWKLDYLNQKKDYDNTESVETGGWFEKHNEYRTQRFGAAVDGSLPLGENHLVEFLANYAHETLDAAGDIVDLSLGRDNFSLNTWNVQAQDTINLNKAGTFWLTPLVRWNASDGEGKFSWNIALTRRFGEHWTVKATGGQYNRAPNLYEKYGDGAFVRPSTNLRWEDGTQWDLGATWTGKIKETDVTASLTYFGRHSNNLIEYVMVSPRYAQYQNIGKADINGIEFEGLADWNKWQAKLSATWMKTENKTEDSAGYGEPLPNRPEWETMLRLTRKFMKDDAASAFVEFHYLGGNYYDTIGAVRMDDLFTTGIGAKIALRKDLKLSFGVDDVFDAGADTMMVTVKNGPDRTMWFPLQGRTFYATLTWDF